MGIISNRDLFTASFYNSEMHFSIENLSPNYIKNIPISLRLAEKMILRGVQTTPSYYLSKQLEHYYPKHLFNPEYQPFFINSKEPKWLNTILGNPETDDNPALLFYENLSKDLKDFSFASKLFIPEYRICDFIPGLISENKFNKDTRVDFFLPHCLLVIEIDGKHHEKIKDGDRYRDESLARYGCKILRISTDSVRNRNNEYLNKIEEIYQLLKNSDALIKYKESFKKKLYSSNKDSSLGYVAVAICRLQVLIIQLIKRGQLKLNSKEWKISISSDVISVFNWAELAIEDIFHWMRPISTLYDEIIKEPIITINLISDYKHIDGFLRIDFKLSERPDEDTIPDISVRSSYINSIYTPQKKNDFTQSKIFCDFNKFDSMNSDTNITHSKQIKSPINKDKEASLLLFLKQLFGHHSFKDKQFRIIESIFRQSNTLGLLPTGGGKSLCFQVAGSLQIGCSIVVCPIIALMKDHVEELCELGFSGRVDMISSYTTPLERKDIFKRIREGKIHFLFVSPERFQNKDFRVTVKELSSKSLLSYVVIDEVHCLSEWGHDFRPAYLALSNTIHNILNLKIPIISLTATASYNVLINLKSELKLEEEDVVYGMERGRDELNFDIINIEKNVKNQTNREEVLLDRLDAIIQEKDFDPIDSSGIIFTPHVNGALGCYELQVTIKNKFKHRINTGFFSGMAPKKWSDINVDNKKISYNKRESAYNVFKYNTQDSFKANKIQLMVATKSFGMGINKKNIRFSIHYTMPISLESLYQEAGRSGRDGNTAKNIVLFEKNKDIKDTLYDKDTSIKDLQSATNIRNRSDFFIQLYMIMSDKLPLDEEVFNCTSLIRYFYDQEINKSPLYTDVKKQILRRKSTTFKSERHFTNLKNRILDEDFDNLINELENYRNKTKNNIIIDIPLKYITSNGYPLGYWFSCLKTNYQLNFISENQADKLKRALGVKELIFIEKINPEVVLYRLFQLGIVSDWLVEDHFSKIYTVTYKIIKAKEIGSNVLNEIQKFEPSESELKIHKQEIDGILEDRKINTRIPRLVKYFLQWCNQHFLYNRRQSLKTIHDYCTVFDKHGPEDFKRKIDAYFRVDSQSRQIFQHLDENFEQAPKSLNKVLMTNKNSLLPTEEIKELTFLLARYLESYENNPWLDLLSSMCRLITKSFDDGDGRVRLYHFISESKKNSTNWINTLTNFLDFAKFLNDEEKLILSQAVEPFLEDLDELLLLHKYLQDSHSALMYINRINRRLENVF